VVFGIKGFFEMYSQKTSNVILFISGVLTFVIFYIVLSNTVSRVGHFPKIIEKPQVCRGVFFFAMGWCNQISVIGWINSIAGLEKAGSS
jgi:hypothetical protein